MMYYTIYRKIPFTNKIFFYHHFVMIRKLSSQFKYLPIHNSMFRQYIPIYFVDYYRDFILIFSKMILTRQFEKDYQFSAHFFIYSI